MELFEKSSDLMRSEVELYVVRGRLSLYSELGMLLPASEEMNGWKTGCHLWVSVVIALISNRY